MAIDNDGSPIMRNIKSITHTKINTEKTNKRKQDSPESHVEFKQTKFCFQDRVLLIVESLYREKYNYMFSEWCVSYL